MRKEDRVFKELVNSNPEALYADGLESTFIGLCYKACSPTVAVYDYDGVICLLMERDSMTLEEAMEFFEFNLLGTYLGENTPVFVKLNKMGNL